MGKVWMHRKWTRLQIHKKNIQKCSWMNLYLIDMGVTTVKKRWVLLLEVNTPYAPDKSWTFTLCHWWFHLIRTGKPWPTELLAAASFTYMHYMPNSTGSHWMVTLSGKSFTRIFMPTHTRTYTHTHTHTHTHTRIQTFPSLKEIGGKSGDTDTSDKILNTFDGLPRSTHLSLHIKLLWASDGCKSVNDQASPDHEWSVYDSSDSLGKGESHRSCVTPGLRCVMTTWHACFFSMRGGIVIVR